MRTSTQANAAQLIAGASVVIVVLVLATTGASIWRSSNASGSSNHALAASSTALSAERALAAFGQESKAVDGFVFSRGKTPLPQVADAASSFDHLTAGLAAKASRGAPLLARARAANRAYIALLRATALAAGRAPCRAADRNP